MVPPPSAYGRCIAKRPIGYMKKVARPAETEKVRRWNGVEANANELDGFRVWVVWGLTAPPERAADPDQFPPGGPGNDLAVTIAAGNDPEFAKADDDHRWVMLVEGDE